jgi:hypothetical protein
MLFRDTLPIWTNVGVPARQSGTWAGGGMIGAIARGVANAWALLVEILR